MARTSRSPAAASSAARAANASPPPASSADGRLIASGTPLAIAVQADSTVATVTRPAPPRTAPRAARIAAPALPREPATRSTCPKSPLWAAERPFRQLLRQLLRDQYLEIARGARAEIEWHSQIGDRELPDPLRRRQQQVRELRRAEGHRRLGTNRRTDRMRPAGVQSTRDIDREARRRQRVHPLHELGVRRGERPFEAGAEERVDDEVGAGGRRGALLPVLSQLDDRELHRLADLELPGAVVAQTGARPKWRGRDRPRSRA